MTDPHQILGVSPTASDDEIKKAYRELARKYHPDNYHDNPLADLAQEKMKEINAAYAEIQRRRGGAGSGNTTTYQSHSYQYGQQSSSGNALFYQVRLAINRNDLHTAEQLLAQIVNHDAEWNYLKGTICYRRGWIDEARRYYQNAYQMEPSNVEYRRALDHIETGNVGYRPEGYDVYSTGCGDNICSKVLCTYLLCNACSFGGMRFICC